VADKDLRQMPPQGTLGAQAGPQTIVVRQVVGENERQKVLDVHVAVPDPKPGIEQIIDVFVKNVEVTNVEVITDKVIVRGEFEIKAIYVACLPNQPVHAVELRHQRFTQDVDIPGARRGMDADATVSVEFVDYDIAEYTRAYKHKYGCKDVCEEEEEEAEEAEICPPYVKPPVMAPVAGETAAAEEMPPCPPPPPPPAPEECGLREFDVSVVLKVVAKVLTERQVMIGAPPPPPPAPPTMPKG